MPDIIIFVLVVCTPFPTLPKPLVELAAVVQNQLQHNFDSWKKRKYIHFIQNIIDIGIHTDGKDWKLYKFIGNFNNGTNMAAAPEVQYFNIVTRGKELSNKGLLYYMYMYGSSTGTSKRSYQTNMSDTQPNRVHINFYVRK